MLIRTAFWGLVAIDTMGVLLLFVLGLAAAGSSRTNPLTVFLLLFVLPGIPLGAAVLLFLRATSPAWRAVAFLLAAAPLLVAVSARALAEVQLRANTNERGELTFFRAGPMRDIAEAIARNDARTVAALVPRVDVNRRGMSDMTLLMSALRQLRRTPDRQEVLKVLLDAGADPNVGTDYELPLATALQLVDTAGAGPVTLLLDAGADPNLAQSFGVPVYFGAIRQGAEIETLRLLLDRGAKVNAVGAKGETALFAAAATRNWPAALLLLERGADVTLGRSANGLSFRSTVEGYAGAQDAEPGLSEVLAHLRRRQ